ncbi:hypothetical protein LJR255_004953 [Pararhizobium sp. LjRoot255]
MGYIGLPTAVAIATRGIDATRPRQSPG